MNLLHLTTTRGGWEGKKCSMVEVNWRTEFAGHFSRNIVVRCVYGHGHGLHTKIIDWFPINNTIS